MKETYSTQILCRGCKRPLVAKVLLNVYSQDIVHHPHFELVCESCGYGQVILTDKSQETCGGEK